MKLKGESLEAEFEAQCRRTPNALPASNKTQYEARYAAIRAYMNANIHPFVVSGAAISDGGFLTDHGPDHIATVIERASRLIEANYCKLSPYEMYLLLCAIHFHDAGNAFGRDKHEKRPRELMDELGALMGTDSLEKRMIAEIATAHGGVTSENDKDTIDRLVPQTPILGKEIRPQLLAAILRFADELADDSHRAARYLIEKGKVPKSSEVFHLYADRLHSVEVKPEVGEVALHFYISLNHVCKHYGKGNGETRLLDEIFERTLKMHLERDYCRRFMAPSIDIRAIKVKIEIYDQKFYERLDTIEYTLKDRGYPTSQSMSIYEVAPELQNWSQINRVNGTSLAERLCQSSVPPQDPDGETEK